MKMKINKSLRVLCKNSNAQSSKSFVCSFFSQFLCLSTRFIENVRAKKEELDKLESDLFTHRLPQLPPPPNISTNASPKTPKKSTFLTELQDQGVRIDQELELGDDLAWDEAWSDRVDRLKRVIAEWENHEEEIQRSLLSRQEEGFCLFVFVPFFIIFFSGELIQSSNSMKTVIFGQTVQLFVQKLKTNFDWIKSIRFV
jgi:hypothetical protein